jgi:hypothetical protein
MKSFSLPHGLKFPAAIEGDTLGNIGAMEDPKFLRLARHEMQLSDYPSLFPSNSERPYWSVMIPTYRLGVIMIRALIVSSVKYNEN